MRKGIPGALLITILAGTLLAGCASSRLQEAKNAYNTGDFIRARDAAARAGAGDPQASLISARAGTRLLFAALPGVPADAAALRQIAADLRRASAGYPFAQEWANRELATGIADWLMLSGLPEIAAVYYGAAIAAPGEDIDPAEAAATEGFVQAGLESLDRWGTAGRERTAALRELNRIADDRLEETGWPYPAGIADQALRVAWEASEFKNAWIIGSAGWLRASAANDGEGTRILDGRLDDLVFPAWRENADPDMVAAVEMAWMRAQRSWGR